MAQGLLQLVMRKNREDEDNFEAEGFAEVEDGGGEKEMKNERSAGTQRRNYKGTVH